MGKLLYKDYRDIIKKEWQSTDWIVPELPSVISWKDAPWWLSACAWVIRLVTFGKVDMPKQYAVMLNTVIVSEDPDSITLSTYFHECWHMLQIKESGGWFYFLFIYLFLPFPLFWTRRSRKEWEAYAVSAWVEGVESLSQEYRRSGKSYTLAVGSRLYNKLVLNPGNRKDLKRVFFSVPYFFMDIKWKHRAKSFDIVRPSYFYRKDDPQCIIRVPWRTEDEYSSAMKGFYQLMHRVLTKY